MSQKLSAFKIKGMSRDLAVSSFSPEYAYENKNIRITADTTNTLYTIVNELGNTKISLGESYFDSGAFRGIPIGYCTLNNQTVIFCSEFADLQNPDSIYILSNNDDGELTGICVFSGNLNFNSKNPIETLGYYENESIQKVYWVDGINQPRVLNIKRLIEDYYKNNNTPSNDSGQFDFVRNLSFNETVTIDKKPTGGIFSVGTIQYHFTYFNKYMQESSIFYSSPIMYCAFTDSGISPEGKAGNSFAIHIENVDYNNFEYLRIYSSQRSAMNATPEARKVIDIELKDSSTIDFIDTGEYGSIIDFNTLFYLGGTKIIADTFSQKDNTLFLGGITIKNEPIQDPDFISLLKECAGTLQYNTFGGKSDFPETGGYYPYINNLKKEHRHITTFKYLEWYRFGLQFQYDNGKWSEAIFLKDLKNELKPDSNIHVSLNKYIGSYYPTRATLSLKNINGISIQEYIDKYHIVNVRPLIVFPSINDRECICQGVVNPTVFNAEDRYNNTPHAISSWYFRPNAPYQIPKLSSGEDDTNAIWSNNIGTITDRSNVSQWSSNAVVSMYQGTQYFTNSLGKKDLAENWNYGAALEFRHNRPIPGNNYRNAEIQCINNTVAPGGLDPTQTTELFLDSNNNKNRYYIDQSIVTFHSPEIEFDTDVQLLDTAELNFRIIGAVPITSNISDIDIQEDASADVVKTYTGVHLQKPKCSTLVGNPSESVYAWRALASGIFYFDEIQYTHNSGHISGFVVYPWHRTTFLNNNGNRKSSEAEFNVGRLKSKILSNLRTSYNTIYYEPSNIWGNNNRDEFITDMKFFNSNELTAVKLKSPVHKSINSDIIYYGNYDRVLTTSTVIEDGATGRYGYFYMLPENEKNTNTIHWSSNMTSELMREYMKCNYTSIEQGQLKEAQGRGSNDPVRIKFKSTPHAIISFQDVEYGGVYCPTVLPTIRGINEVQEFGTDYSYNLFWDKNYGGIRQETLPDILNFGRGNERFGWLWLGEIYRPDTPELQKTRFGGNTPEAIENNLWLPAGDVISLKDVDFNKGVRIVWDRGDTYFQRYDHLKTYPFTQEDQQSMVDILSFMCESRINLDGRYDTNRGLSSNLHITPTNFNKINTAYTQNDNLFTYRTINENKISNNYHPNTIMWSKTKILGDLIDTWTNISTASVMDLDGDKGSIRAIRRINDKLIAFQDRGISQILYNEKEQLATTEGQAVEISNSGKVSGKRYITTNNGCVNKWSIQEGRDSLYFIDDITKSFLAFNGESIVLLTHKLGMKSWFNKTCNLNIWNPVDFNNVISYYDKTTSDIYYLYKDTALAYNDKLQIFTSFYDYADTPYWFVMNNKSYVLHTSEESHTRGYHLWQQFSRPYNNIYDGLRSFYTTVIANTDPTIDKVFNTVEYRASTFLQSGEEDIDDIPFNTLHVWNEYQSATCSLDYNPRNPSNHPSSLKRKFRIWRANIPRDGEKVGIKKLKGDRMRNPWLYVKLEYKPEIIEDQNKVELQDIIVHYTY